MTTTFSLVVRTRSWRERCHVQIYARKFKCIYHCLVTSCTLQICISLFLYNQYSIW